MADQEQAVRVAAEAGRVRLHPGHRQRHVVGDLEAADAVELLAVEEQAAQAAQLRAVGVAERGLARAERDYASAPEDARLAIALVRQLTDTGRRLADPRYYGRAEAILVRFRAQHPDMLEFDVAWADVLQHRHDYDAARRVLDALLDRVPDAAQPRLMRAQMNLAQGRYDEAARDCRALLRAGGYGMACLAQVMGMTGDLARGYALLARGAGAQGSPALRSWVLTALGDMAARQADAGATGWLEQALAADPDDQYARLALADAYIDAGELLSATRVVHEGPQSDAALLRLAIIEARRGAPASASTEVGQRFAEALARGEPVHLRDLARYRLEVAHDPRGALSAAERNFDSQRETIDVHVLLLSARAAHDRAAVERYRRWRDATHYEDRSAQALIAWTDAAT